MDGKKHGNEKHPARAVINAIVGSAGIKTTIGRRLGVHRHTVDRYLTNYPLAALAYKNEVDTIGDLVEGVILEAIRNKDVETAKWYAKNKLKNRGYTERQEVTGSDGKDLPPLQIILQKKEETNT